MLCSISHVVFISDTITPHHLPHSRARCPRGPPHCPRTRGASPRPPTPLPPPHFAHTTSPTPLTLNPTPNRVKYAVNTETNEAVAIKILDKDKIQARNMGAQIKKEISIMKMINHHHVVGEFF